MQRLNIGGTDSGDYRGTVLGIQINQGGHEAVRGATTKL
jgi:hypothetical protein